MGYEHHGSANYVYKEGSSLHVLDIEVLERNAFGDSFTQHKKKK
jgi:hypothetical protein